MPTLWREQVTAAAQDGRRAVDRICDAWPSALESAAARGFGVRGGDPGRAPAGSHSDKTGSLGCRSDRAADWLRRCRIALMQLLTVTSEAGSDRRWTGAFHPPGMRRSMGAAVADLANWQPRGWSRLLDQLVALGNEAAREWPPTPKSGQVVDGVVVGRHRGGVLEDCALCDQVVLGTAADPIVRIDGKPYHKSTCYHRVRRRGAAG